MIITDDLVMGAIYNHNICTASWRRSTQASICCLSLSMVRNSIASLRARLKAFSEGKLDTATLRDGERRLKRTLPAD